MIKKLVIAGVVVAAGYLGSTWYVGQTAQEYLQKTVELDNARLKKYVGDAVYYSIENFQKGLFTSTATHRINIKLPGFDKQIDTQYVIQNGPFPWADLKQGNFTPKRFSFNSELTKNDFVAPIFDLAEKPLQVNGSVSFSNVETGIYKVAPFKIDTSHQNTNFKLDFAGMDMDYSLDREPYITSASGKIPSVNLSIQDNDVTLTLNSSDWNIKSAYDFSDEKINGSSDVQVGQVHYNADGIDVELKNLLQQDKLHDDGKMIGLDSKSQAKELIVQGVNIGGIVYDINYGQIDSGAAKQVFDIALNMLKEAISKADTLSEQQLQEIFMKEALKLGALTMTAFSHGPIMQYGPIKLTNSQGSADVVAKMGFLAPNLSKMTAPDFDENAMMLSMLNSVDVEVSANAPWFAEFLPKMAELAYKIEGKELIDLKSYDFKQISEFLEKGLVDSKLFFKDGNRFKFQIAAKAPEKEGFDKIDSITINGEKQDLMATFDILNERSDKAASLLEENGFIPAVQAIFEPLQDSNNFDEEIEEGMAEDGELSGMQDNPLNNCAADDQECIDSVNQTGQVMSDEELAKILCKADDAECLKVFTQ